MPVKKRPKTKAEQEQAQKAQEAQEAQAQQQKAQEQKAQEAQELSPTTESSRSSGSNETYTKEIERTMLLGEAESRGRIKLWADEAEDSGSNPTYDKSIVRPSFHAAKPDPHAESEAESDAEIMRQLRGIVRPSFHAAKPDPHAESEAESDAEIMRQLRGAKKQREEDQFEEDASYLSEEDLPAFWECSDEAREIGWGSETQQAFAGAVSADAMTDGEMSEESWPILRDLLFGGRGGFPK